MIGSWGGGGRDDWAYFAERMGNAILEICPRWLIAVEGVGGGGTLPPAAELPQD